MTGEVFQFVNNGAGASCLPKGTSLPFMMLHLGELDTSVEYMVELDSFKNLPTNLTDLKEEVIFGYLFLELPTFIKSEYPSKKCVSMLQKN